MKDILTALKKESPNKFVRSLPKDSELITTSGKLNTWFLLNQMEAILDEPLEVLHKVAPHYQKNTKEVNLEITGTPKNNLPFEIEARFYKIDKRNLEVKVFARQIQEKKKSLRIAKASFFIEAKYYPLAS